MLSYEMTKYRSVSGNNCSIIYTCTMVLYSCKLLVQEIRGHLNMTRKIEYSSSTPNGFKRKSPTPTVRTQVSNWLLERESPFISRFMDAFLTAFLTPSFWKMMIGNFPSTSHSEQAFDFSPGFQHFSIWLPSIWMTCFCQN